MTAYGQFCPVAKSTEILGDPWSLLIVRELLLGTSRFSEFQKALSRISPTVLNTRLKTLEACGVIVRRKRQGQRGHEYRLTPAGRELAPVVEALAVWGMRWARDRMTDDELDISLLVFDIQRRIDTDALPDGETVLCIQIGDLSGFDTWWLVIADGAVDLCHKDPGKDVDLFIAATARDLVALWMGDEPVARLTSEERVLLTGDRTLRRTFTDWFLLSSAAVVPRPEPSTSG